VERQSTESDEVAGPPSAIAGGSGMVENLFDLLTLLVPLLIAMIIGALWADRGGK